MKDCPHCQNERWLVSTDTSENGNWREERVPCPHCRGVRIMALEHLERMRRRYHTACTSFEIAREDAQIRKKKALYAMRAARRVVRQFSKKER